MEEPSGTMGEKKVTTISETSEKLGFLGKETPVFTREQTLSNGGATS